MTSRPNWWLPWKEEVSKARVRFKPNRLSSSNSSRIRVNTNHLSNNNNNLQSRWIHHNLNGFSQSMIYPMCLNNNNNLNNLQDLQALCHNHSNNNNQIKDNRFPLVINYLLLQCLLSCRSQGQLHYLMMKMRMMVVYSLPKKITINSVTY